MKRLFLIGAAFVIAIPSAVAAQPAPSAQGAAATQAAPQRPDLKTLAAKRQFLRNELTRGLNHPQQVGAVRQQLDRLSPKQIHALTEIALAQQLPQGDAAAMQQAQFELQRALWLRQMLANDLWWRRYNSVGYMPVIGWLPQGTSLGASAVVSPDGRHVRVSPAPFFSSVGPVYSYNLNTGQTRLMPQYGPGYPPYANPGYGVPNGYPRRADSQHGQMPSWHTPTPPSRPRPRIWYDGLRTRVEYDR